MNPPPVAIRPASADDFVSIVALERATEFAPHWAPATYAAILDAPGVDPRRCLFVALKGEALVGFAVGLMHPSLAETDEPPSVRCAELESVVVASAARRLGIGRTLCTAVVDWSRTHSATEVILEVRACSSGAIALYTILGFTCAGRRPRYYREPNDDALVMRISLECDQTASPQAPPSSPA